MNSFTKLANTWDVYYLPDLEMKYSVYSVEADDDEAWSEDLYVDFDDDTEYLLLIKPDNSRIKQGDTLLMVSPYEAHWIRAGSYLFNASDLLPWKGKISNTTKKQFILAMFSKGAL